MSHIIKLNTAISRINMKSLRIWILSAISLVGIMTTGCDKETAQSKDKDEYYVKYIVDGSTIYIGNMMNVSIVNERNETTTISIDQRSSREIIVGPVKKGFKAKMSVKATSGSTSNLKLYTEIHTSKNNGPFTLRVIDSSNTPRSSVLINYTIDY